MKLVNYSWGVWPVLIKCVGLWLTYIVFIFMHQHTTFGDYNILHNRLNDLTCLIKWIELEFDIIWSQHTNMTGEKQLQNCCSILNNKYKVHAHAHAHIHAIWHEKVSRKTYNKMSHMFEMDFIKYFSLD